MHRLESVVKEIQGDLADDSADSYTRAIRDALRALRALVGMEVSFVGRFVDGRRRFEFLDHDDSVQSLHVGDSAALESTYCARVVDGRLAQLVPDTSLDPEVSHLAVTSELSIGSYLSAPLTRADGSPLGTLCCYSRQPDNDLRNRDVELIDVFARVIGGYLSQLVVIENRSAQVREQVDRVLAAEGPRMALQPIVDTVTGGVYGYEALARFDDFEGWAPDRWFHEAARVGLGHELEIAAIRAALRLLPSLSADLHLSVNISAQTLCTSTEAVDLLAGLHSPRLVVELTEHTEVHDYDHLMHAMSRVRAAGAVIAIDDAGTGWSGLDRLLLLRPEVLKLDRALIQGIAHDSGRQALCAAMVGFTARTGSRLVAEGVETGEDLDALRVLGVPLVQGFFVGRPQLSDVSPDGVAAEPAPMASQPSLAPLEVLHG